MPEIKIKVRDKCAEGEGVIICNNSDYAVVWDLDGEWTPYGTKTMRVNLADGTYQDVVFTGDNAALPVLTASGWVSVGLYAGDIHTTRAARLLALSSVLTPGGAPAAPAEDVYAQIMAKLNELSTVSPEDIAKAVADYLAAHPIKETDPTVPEWAKAETKPTYSAAEVGAIAQSDLQAATDAALAQAKASGEFDGPRGPAGAPGKDGAGMDITGATIGQIAKITAVDSDGKPTAWSPVDMPMGGGEPTQPELLLDLTIDSASVIAENVDFSKHSTLVILIGGEKGAEKISMPSGKLFAWGHMFWFAYYSSFLPETNSAYPKGGVAYYITRIAPDLARVDFCSTVTTDIYANIYLQMNSTIIANTKTGNCLGTVTDKQDGVDLRFSAEVNDIKLQIFGA